MSRYLCARYNQKSYDVHRCIRARAEACRHRLRRRLRRQHLRRRVALIGGADGVGVGGASASPPSSSRINACRTRQRGRVAVETQWSLGGQCVRGARGERAGFMCRGRMGPLCEREGGSRAAGEHALGVVWACREITNRKKVVDPRVRGEGAGPHPKRSTKAAKLDVLGSSGTHDGEVLACSAIA